MDEQKAAGWFGTVELKDCTPSQGAFLDELVEMLDVYDPPLLDREKSVISDRGEHWTKADTIEVRLVHSSDSGIAIEVGLSPDEAIVVWLTAHQHINEREVEGGDRAWTSVAVDVVAGILRGDIEVEDTYRGKRLVKTRLIDAATPGDPRPITETWSLFGWIPLPRSKRVERRRVGFGAKSPHG